MHCFNAGCFDSMDRHYVTVSETGEEKWVIYCENPNQPFVVLSNDDVELWELLHWEICGSSVFVTQIENAVKLAVVFCVLAAINFVIGMSLLPVENAFIKAILSLLLCGVASALEVWTFMHWSTALYKFRCAWATFWWIMKRVWQKKATIEHYHDILIGLSYARCRHKAEAARFMAKII